MSEEHYVIVGRVATVVVVVLGFAWLPIMMKMDTLYNYLQGIQSLLAPAMVAVFAMGIFSKKITPKSGEYTMIVGFLIGMVRLVTNVITDTGKSAMDGAFWDACMVLADQLARFRVLVARVPYYIYDSSELLHSSSK